MAQFGRALRSGRRGRVFKSRRLDHKPHYKAVYWLCDAVLIFKAVTFCYVLDYRFGTREVCTNSRGCPVLGRVFCSAVFFVYCGSIFETLPTESYVGIEFFGVGYSSVFPFMRYCVKHEIPLLILLSVLNFYIFIVKVAKSDLFYLGSYSPRV